MSRPEHTAAADAYYNQREAKKYTESARLVAIQRTMTARALELLDLRGTGKLLLDIGCGSAICGEMLGRAGHAWIGFDISRSMLLLARERAEFGGLAEADMGEGLPCRPGSVDGAVSISAVQWLCVRHNPRQNPTRRLSRFFRSLWRCLVRGGKAVLQFYPETTAQMSMIASAARAVGFTGGLITDYPRSAKRKKFFLCLQKGGGGARVARRDHGAMPREPAPAPSKPPRKRQKGNRKKERQSVASGGGKTQRRGGASGAAGSRFQADTWFNS